MNKRNFILCKTCHKKMHYTADFFKNPLNVSIYCLPCAKKMYGFRATSNYGKKLWEEFTMKCSEKQFVWGGRGFVYCYKHKSKSEDLS